MLHQGNVRLVFAAAAARGNEAKLFIFFYLPSLFKTQKKQLIWDPFFYGCPRAAKLNNTSKMVSYDRQTRHQCIVLHRLLSNFFWWSHWTLTSKLNLHAFSSSLQIHILCKIWLFFFKFIYSEKATKFLKNVHLTFVLCSASQK